MDANRFLAQYKEAWETKNPDLAALLFTRDAHYHETPFDEPIVGREAIRAYWKGAPDTQQDIHFAVRDSFTVGHTPGAEWGAALRDKPGGGRRRRLGRLLGRGRPPLPRVLAPPRRVEAALFVVREAEPRRHTTEVLL